jgi:hypothetical protein
MIAKTNPHEPAEIRTQLQLLFIPVAGVHFAHMGQVQSGTGTG